jgi:hypothetical protein
MATDWVSEALSRVSGLDNGVAGMDYDVSGYGDDIVGQLGPAIEGMIDDHVSGLVEVGALTEVGARRAKKVMRAGIAQGIAKKKQPGGNLASPPFAMSGRDTERRAPLGFTEDGTGANFFSLAAAIGATTTMRAKVSRVAHVDRLLIVPSATGSVISSILVGDEEQALASGVPSELYGTSALTDTVPDNFSPIGPGLDFIVVLKNTTAGAITGTIGTKCACKR